jgi:DNA-binding transcriptional MerR regulator
MKALACLQAVERTANGYRTYPREAVVVLDLIATAQKAGFTLDEIRALLPSNLENWQHSALVDALQSKIADIEALETRLKQTKKQLTSMLREINDRPGDIDCAANARRVLTRLSDGDIDRPVLNAGDVKLLGKSDRRRPAKVN